MYGFLLVSCSNFVRSGLQCLGSPVVAYWRTVPENVPDWGQLCRFDQRSEGVWSGLHQTVMVVGYLIGPRCWWCALSVSSVYSGCGVDTIDQHHRMYSQPLQPKSPHHTERLTECSSYTGAIWYRLRCGSANVAIESHHTVSRSG